MQKRYPLAAFAAVIAMAAARAWTSDDAFITFRVVEQFLAGHGPVFNIGERVQVFTHPLWFLALSAWAALGGSLFPGSMWLSLALFGAGLAFLFVAFREKPVALVAVGTAVFFSRSLMDYATGGLETALSFALFAAAVGALRSGWTRAALALFALLPLNRLDLLPWALPFAWIAAPPNLKARALAFIALCAPAAAWALFSTIYYGAPLPNTALAKLGGGIAGRLDQGTGYVVASLASDPGAMAIVVIGMVIAARLWRGGTPAQPVRDLQMVAAGAASAAIGLAYVIWCGGDFMLGRFLLPILWPLIPAILAGFPRPGGSPSPLGEGRGEGGATVSLPVPLGEGRGEGSGRGEGHDLRAAAAAFALLAALHLLTGQSATNLWLHLGSDAPLRQVNYLGALDERRFYIPWLGAYSPGRFMFISPPAPPPSTGKPIIAGPLGRKSYLAARDQALVDIFALAEPFLARIAPLPNGRPGHELRPRPPEFARWRESGHRFHDARLDELARDLRLAHLSKDLWSLERARAIFRLAVAKPVRLDGLAISDDAMQWSIDIKPSVLYQGPTDSAKCRVWLRLYDASGLVPWLEYTSALDRQCQVSTVPKERNEETTIEMGCAETLSLRCPKDRLGGGGILMRVGVVQPSQGGRAAALYDDIVPILRPPLRWVGSVPRWVVQGWNERPRPAVIVALLLLAGASGYNFWFRRKRP